MVTTSGKRGDNNATLFYMENASIHFRWLLNGIGSYCDVTDVQLQTSRAQYISWLRYRNWNVEDVEPYVEPRGPKHCGNRERGPLWLIGCVQLDIHIILRKKRTLIFYASPFMIRYLFHHYLGPEIIIIIPSKFKNINVNNETFGGCLCLTNVYQCFSLWTSTY